MRSISQDSWNQHEATVSEWGCKPQTCVSNSSLILQTRWLFVARGHSSKNNWNMYALGIDCCTYAQSLCLFLTSQIKSVRGKKLHSGKEELKSENEIHRRAEEGRGTLVIYNYTWHISHGKRKLSQTSCLSLICQLDAEALVWFQTTCELQLAILHQKQCFWQAESDIVWREDVHCEN